MPVTRPGSAFRWSYGLGRRPGRHTQDGYVQQPRLRRAAPAGPSAQHTVTSVALVCTQIGTKRRESLGVCASPAIARVRPLGRPSRCSPTPHVPETLGRRRRVAALPRAYVSGDSARSSGIPSTPAAPYGRRRPSSSRGRAFRGRPAASLSRSRRPVGLIPSATGALLRSRRRWCWPTLDRCSDWGR